MVEGKVPSLAGTYQFYYQSVAAGEILGPLTRHHHHHHHRHYHHQT